jgi:hypothetical protein
MRTTLTDHAGNWWLPSNPDTIKQGILKYKDESFILELHDGRQLPSKERIFKTIFGITTSGCKITLNGLYENGYRSYNSEVNISYYLIDYVLFNDHLPEDKLLFNNFFLKISKVDKWVGLEGLSEETVTNKEGQNTKKLSIIYDIPATKIIDIPNYGKLYWHKNLSVTNNNLGARCILEGNNFEFEINERTDLKTFFKRWAFSLSSFFSFLLREKVFPISISATGNNKKRIEIYNNMQNEMVESSNSDNFKLHFTVVKNNILPMLNAWLNLTEDMLTVFANFLIKDSFKPIPVEFEFLSLFQAFEGFSRSSRHTSLYMGQEEHKNVIEQIKKAIPENIDKDFKTSLNSRLKFSNEFSLRKRLSTEIKRHQEILEEITIDWNKFLSNSVDARNYLTHDLNDQDLEKPSLRHLIDLTYELKCLLRVLIFTHLGLEKNALLNLLKWYGYKINKI